MKQDLFGSPTNVNGLTNYNTSYTYDHLNRMHTMTQPLVPQIVTSYGYDTHDNLTSITDPKGNITQYPYDDFGRRIKVISPDTGTTIYSHDEAGNISTKTDAKGTVLNYTYDALNRITATQFTDSTQNITYTYDSTSVTNGKGRLTGRTDFSGSYTFSYDVRGNLIQEDKTISNVNYRTQYTYNKDNVLTSITYPTGRVITYTPDVTGRITQVDTTLNGNPKTLASSITYYPYGGVGGLTYGNGLLLTHGYDNQYRTSSVAVGSILSRTYGYDDNGNVTSITDPLMSSNGQGVEQARGYIYESGTNLLDDVWGEVSVVYDYDDNGNTIIQNNRAYVYDLSNRLITVQDNSVTIAQYVYNALNQRVKKILSGGMTIFHYDLRGHLIAETTQTGTILAEYINLGDEPLAMLRPGEVAYYYHNDHLGTPQILTNEAKNIAWKASYKPYGEAVISIETVENPFRFPGRYYDQETSLHYNWNRYYDPKTGRYSGPDPIGLEGGVNLFVCVANNPIIKNDFLGLEDSSNGNCPPLPDEWKQAINEGLTSFCTSDQADFKKIRCMIWAECSDNPNPRGGLPGGGLMQIKWELWETKCKEKIKNFDKNRVSDQIKCGIYILCKEKGGKLGREGYGTVDRPGSHYQQCMEGCCK